MRTLLFSEALKGNFNCLTFTSVGLVLLLIFIRLDFLFSPYTNSFDL
jgi:hypothetical protein